MRTDNNIKLIRHGDSSLDFEQQALRIFKRLFHDVLQSATSNLDGGRHACRQLDQFVIHQISRAHTEAFTKAFGIDKTKVLTIFAEHGNIGPASVPIVLSKLRDLGKLKKGTRVALLGIGSGLNCSMAEVVWNEPAKKPGA